MKTTLLLAAALLLANAAHADEAKLNDPQIANIALTAHNIDIARGKLALERTKSELVKVFAQQMVDDHQAGVREAVALATKLGVKPEESAVSKSLDDGAHQATKRLRKEHGEKFDKDYIDTEVAYHQAVIGAVRDVLVPGAQNEQLKTLLQQAVPTLEGHLQHAKNVQAALGEKAAKE
jgi:putative membrane protein